MAAPKSSAIARINVAVQALTGLRSKGSWRPTLLAINQTTNQIKVIGQDWRARMPGASGTSRRAVQITTRPSQIGLRLPGMTLGARADAPQSEFAAGQLGRGRAGVPMLPSAGDRGFAICSPSVTKNESSPSFGMPLARWRKQSPKRWRRPAGVVPVAVAMALASATLSGGVPVAAASSSDAQATHAYLIAQYRLATGLLHGVATARRAEGVAAAQIARGCPGVVSGMPREPSLKPFPAPLPRVRGEDARLDKQRQTIEEELGAAVARAGGTAYRPSEEAYAAEVRALSWSNPAIASALRAATTARLEAASAPAPPFCADASAWAQSGYRALSAASREFEASRAARKSLDRQEGLAGTLLKPYEDTSDRALIRKTNRIGEKLLVESLAAVQTVFRVARIVGFPEVGGKERKRTVLARGRTAAGTRFEVSSDSGPLGLFGSCHRSATVAYSRPGAPEILIVGGPNNPICLSPPRYRHPALFCEAGLETIQAAVPASVRSVKLVLADGRTIGSRVVHVPRRDGGPAGIYAQQLRGSASHAVSLVELDAGGGVVLTIKLPRYRCVKRRTEPEGLPMPTELAHGQTPDGEAFAISTFGSFNGEPAVNIDTGVDPELNEITIGPGAPAPKAFPWSLSIGCAPHPYAILYGILAPPGKSVVAQTPQGAVALNLVPIEPRLHAKGPLVYGVFGALPSQLTVLAADGSTVYTESLQAKAAEAAQFCEGYAEA